MSFIHDDFLLQSEAAKRLYHEYAESEPIFDHHCHLSAKDVAEDRRFANLHEIWLEGDHYKWRAMRANGVEERLISGDASAYDKFCAWANTVPYTLGNPLYHWTHLELKRYFSVDELLDESSAQRIWDAANEQLREGALSARGILEKFDVRVVCTTDDPADNLGWHRQIEESGIKTRVYPTFRPDRALGVDRPESFNGWVERLASVSGVGVSDFDGFLGALRKRHDEFHQLGARLSDHGLKYCYAEECSDEEAGHIFDKARRGEAATEEEHSQFASYMMVFFGRLDAERGWTKQLHLGARRDANTRRMQELGPDTGFDSMGDWPQADALGKYLDKLESENALPRVIVYNNNPADNHAFATMIGNFQDGSVPGKAQFGSGWWFLDQKDGIEAQLKALCSVGLLSRFVGMLTDSRSFLSFPRHEYFRRVLCNLLGGEMERGELPQDWELVGDMVRNICFRNAERYFGLAMP